MIAFHLKHPKWHEQPLPLLYVTPLPTSFKLSSFSKNREGDICISQVQKIQNKISVMAKYWEVTGNNNMMMYGFFIN